jgi:subtilase family serine protease
MSHILTGTATVQPNLPTTSQCISVYYGVACYGPQQIRKAYDVPSTLNGAGQTIVIVDAFGSPTIAADLKTFDAKFGLPDTTLNIFYPGGAVNFDTTNGNELGWAVETSLDVEYAHAMAPGATIDLVVARSNRDDDIELAESWAVAHHLGNVMSESYGEPETVIPFGASNVTVTHDHANYSAAAGTGMTVLVAAGDGGANDGRSTAGTSLVGQFPADDPNVTAVGGTDLFTSDDTGTYAGETVWNDSDPTTCSFGCPNGTNGGTAATGGSPSAFWPAPTYQQGITGFSTRSTSDVSWNAGCSTFVWVALSVSPNLDPFFPTTAYGGVCGTSEAAPSFAGAVALADQAAGHGLGNINPWMYSHMVYTGTHPIFHDITVGQNGEFEAGQTILGPGYKAGPGWDAPTGVGSPDVRNFVNAIAGTNY